MDWGGDPVTLQSTPSVQSNHAVAPPYRALYGGGLLRIWADTIYARVMAYYETAASKEAVLSLGQTISANRKIPEEPELLKVLPNVVHSYWKLRKDRIGYFRSHLVLNSLYYLSHQNILNLDHSAEAVTAPYEKTLNDGTSKRVQLLFVKYATQQRARKGLNDFHSAYLDEFLKGFNPDITNKPKNFFNIEDGWLGYALNGTDLTIVFECPNRETAERIIRYISSEAITKEVKREK
jgi:hypothetical protein